MGHGFWLQPLAGVLGTIGAGALVSLARYLRKLLQQVEGLGALRATVARLEATVSSLQVTVETLDEAIAGMWAAAHAGELPPRAHRRG